MLGKRTMDFKVTYLDAGLTSTYFTDSEAPSSNGTSGNNSTTPNASATKVPKRYKAHLRDFLSSCRTKRSKHSTASTASSIAAANVVNDIYAAAAGGDPTVAASAIPYASVYGSAPTSAGTPTYSPTESPLYMQQNAIAASPYQTIYPVDNRYFSTEYLASYRSLTTYYPEYAASAHAAQYIAGNGYFDSARPLASLPGYDPSQFNRYFEDNKNTPECKYKTDFSPSLAPPSTLPQPPPPSSGKI